MTDAITKGIKISVDTFFSGMQEHNYQKYYVYDYYVSIENLSPHTVQLFSRYWEIYDSLSHTEIVKGKGVIGVQPILKFGEKYIYKSHCILLSNFGAMKGYYTMLNLDNHETFKVLVPQFQLQTNFILN